MRITPYKSHGKLERQRLIQNGTITPEPLIKPQMLVKNAEVHGGWSPEIKTYSEEA